jgi:general secretion pathway protein D
MWARIPGARRVGKAASAATLLTAGLAMTLTYAAGQDTPKPMPTDTQAGQKPDTTAKKPTPPGAGKDGTSAHAPALRVVPMRRPGRGAGAPPGAPPITITPGNTPPGAPGPDGLTPGGPPAGAAPMPGGPMAGRSANSGPGGTKVSFTYNGSAIGDVLKFYSRISNKTIIADPNLSGNVTIINPEPVTVDEAFMILQQVLSARGFSAIEKGNVILVVPLATAVTSTGIFNPGVNASGPTAVDPRDQVMTQVIPLDNVEAETLSRELQPLINKGASLVASTGTNSLVLTDTASNVQRFIALSQALDKASANTELRTYPLRRADAAGIADIINNLFKQISSRGRSAAPGGPQPGQPFNPGMQGGQPGGQTGQPAVLAVPDARTNSVLVVASPDNQQKVADEIINRLDGDDSNTLDTKIRKINFANAVDVANMVNQVLNNLYGAGSSASGGGGSTFQQRAFGGGFGGFFGGFGGGGNQNQQTVTSNDPLGKVVAEPRTNSVVITASVDRMKRIDSLIDTLDQEVPVETQTFVFPLKNAQAEDVAYALGQAFQTSSSGAGTGNTFFNFGGNGNGQQSSSGRKQIQRRLGTQSGSGTQFGRGVGRSMVPPGPPNAPDGGDQGDGSGVGQSGGSAIPEGVQGVMTPNGFVPTATPGAEVNAAQSRQFGGGRFGGFGGFGGQQNQNTPQYGRGQNGNYANLLQLQNNVYVTPSPGGDSIIVTTPPTNYQAVKAIVDALDVVPRQVLIETIVAEVTLTKDQKLGYALQGIFKNLAGGVNTATGQVGLGQSGTFNQGTNGLSLDPLGQGAQFVINGANYTVLLQALQNDTNVKVLAATDVFTSNNQEADTNSSEQVPYVQGTTTGGFSTTTSSNIQYQQIGYELDVTPRITREGGVTMDVDTIATSLLGFQTLAGNQVPIVNQRETNTEATVADGQTVVIGGLIQSTDTKTITRIPFLSDIPLVGQFFRSRDHNTTRTELVIFLTPHVVNTASEARAFTERMGGAVSREIPELPIHEPNLNFKGKHSGIKAAPVAPQNRATGQGAGTAPNGGATSPAGGGSQPIVPGQPQRPGQ